MVRKVLVSTAPFGLHNPEPIQILQNTGLEVDFNQFNRRLTERELTDLIPQVEILIAGTEPITDTVLQAATNLRLIARVGIGLDNVDLDAARCRGINVSYTPDAPTPAVAELTLGLILSLLRGIHEANLSLHNSKWMRFTGRRFSEITLGVIGAGRIGSRVISQSSTFGPRRILVHDIENVSSRFPEHMIQQVDCDYLLQHSDVISLHVPLTKRTRNMIDRREFSLMKQDALLVNTSRGGIVNESALFTALTQNQIQSAALDVFLEEPYTGPLTTLPNLLLTCHMGSMSIDCRSQMELDAAMEAQRLVRDEPLHFAVPDDLQN